MSINFETIIDQLLPSTQIETDWTGGMDGLPSSTKKILFLSPKLSAGTGTSGQVYALTNVAKAKTLFGDGSRMAGMVEKAFRVNPRLQIYGMPYAEGTTAATGTVALATTATSSGVLRLWCAGRFCEVPIASGDTPTTVGDDLVAAISQLPNRPFTAANNTGTVTLTARTLGTAGNTIRFRTEITCTGMTATNGGVGAAFTSGATEASPASQLAGIEAQRFHLIVLDSNDSTAATALKTHLESVSAPANAKFGIGIVAFTGTDANAQTLAGTLDSYRMQVVHLENSDLPCWEVAAIFAAVRGSRDARASCAGLEMVGLSSQIDSTKWIDPNQANINLEEGLTPLIPSREGKVTIARSIVTRQTAPISFRDHRIIEISDYCDESLLAAFSSYQSAVLKSASPAGRPDTITPDRGAAIMNAKLLQLDREDYIQGVEDDVKNGSNFAELNATNPDRLDLAYVFRPTRAAHGIAIRKTYTLPTV